MKKLLLVSIAGLFAACASAPSKPPPAPVQPISDRQPPKPKPADVLDCDGCHPDGDKCLRHAPEGAVGPKIYECQPQCCAVKAGESGAACKTDADCERDMICLEKGCALPSERE